MDALLVPRPGSDVLIVSLQGALGKAQVPPRFERYTSLRQRAENVLFVADTTIDPGRGVLLGWYFGTAEDDLQQRLAALILTVANQLRVSRVLLTGSSGGGFAAIAIGQQVPGSTAIAFDPQVRPAKWGEVSFPQRLWGTNVPWRFFEAEFPYRLSLVDALRRSTAIERFVLVQNAGDEHHMTKHLPELQQFLHETGPGRPDLMKRARLVLSDNGPGHVPPTHRQVQAWLDVAVGTTPLPELAIWRSEVAAELFDSFANVWTPLRRIEDCLP
ncbi:MAG: hypothetical protein JWO93_2864 [Micrococcaceae bacterium]|nr:hypothetical protein [Micrococcaceae bacterium]